MRRAIGRSARRTVHRNEHSELENGIADVQKQLDDATKSKSSLALRLKDLKAEKKTLGRAPRNSHSIDRCGNASAIPRVSLQAKDDSVGMYST
jgi:chromosome segregation ATPase